MDKLNLTLRQRKLLHMMQEQTSYITGNELAKQLNVSPRTIRSDVVEINRSIRPYQAEIVSERSKGYFYIAENPEKIQKMNQIDTAFFTKEDRVRYLAFRLCLTDEPLNMYDLEDEMFVSHTTLEHDLHHLEMKYVLSDPYIELKQKKDYLSFEENEKKQRDILNRLFYEDWNYNTSGNTYYGYNFLNKDILDYIMDEVPLHLSKYSIVMEDPSLVSLNLSLAIMYHRTRTGHSLPGSDPVPKPDMQANLAASSILDALEGQLHCSFDQEERDDIYQRIASGHLPDFSNMDLSSLLYHFDPGTLNIADAYIQKIREVFHLDFAGDDDFYITLLSYLQFLQTPVHIFNTQGNPNIVKKNLLAEFEIAYLFQDLALEYLGYYINQTELQYLAHCISGALEFLYETHPETKLKTVICCHLNLSAAWALKRKILGAFDKYLDITALLPVNAKTAFDFKNTDLVLSTVRKSITEHPGTDTIQISNFMSPKDYRTLSAYIQEKQIEQMCPSPKTTVKDLLEHAFWHEKESLADRFCIIEFMATDFIKNHLAGSRYLADILRRESISTHAIGPGILFLHSLIPSSETKLSVTTLDHRIIWNSHKIRIIIMAAFHPDDTSLLFRLLHTFYNDNINIEVLQMLKTKSEIIDFFSESE